MPIWAILLTAAGTCGLVEVLGIGYVRTVGFRRAKAQGTFEEHGAAVSDFLINFLALMSFVVVGLLIATIVYT